MNLLLDLSKKLSSYKDKKFLLALSGGLDSIALLQVFLHLKQHFGFNFAVCHFHHGPCEDKVQLEYRFAAYDFLGSLAKSNNLDFLCNFNGENPELFLKEFPANLVSEDEFRKARYQFLESSLLQQKCDYMVLAHHADDLFETRLLRMIRGVGPEGFVAMKFLQDNRMRPLLEYSRKQLKELLNLKQQSWVEDPSNQDQKALRNWLRNFWLKELEKKSPGSSQSFARSLDLLLESSRPKLELRDYFGPLGVDRGALLSLDRYDQKQVLASYMRSQDLKNYGLSHINEILKRLDNEANNFTFNLLGRRWVVDAGRMRVQEPG